MLSANKLFLLVISWVLFVAACTGGNKRAAPTPLDQKTEDSGEISELQQDMATTLDKITTLHGQVEQGNVGQGQLDSLRQELTVAENKIAQFAQDGNISSDTVQGLKNTVIGLWGQLGKLQQKLDEIDDTDPDEPGPDQPPGDVPVLHVSLVELEEDTEARKAGTYVTFHSDKDVEINSIKYGYIGIKPLESYPTKIASLELPVSVKFTHTGTAYCVSATLGLASLPEDDQTEGAKVEMKLDNREGACQP